MARLNAKAQRKLGKKSTAAAFKPTVPSGELDISAFIEEQQLEIDPEVAELLANPASSTATKKGGKKKNKKPIIPESADEEEEDATAEPVFVEGTEEGTVVEMDSDDEAELAAYLKMTKSEGVENEESDNDLVEKIYANNTTALLSRLKDIRIDQPGFKVPWIETMSVTSLAPLDLAPADVQDDLKRELAFYKQALHAAEEGRRRVRAAKVPFSRPDDFFAEMVKSDEHMARVRQRLLDEAASIQASEKARKQRDLKKFGKKVQQEKLAERVKNKKSEIEKVKVARKKHASSDNSREDADDEFGIELDSSSSTPSRGGGPNPKRKRRDEKFGFGGSKRHKKTNDKTSVDDMAGFSQKRMKSGAKPAAKGKGKPMGSKPRLGKSRRQGGARK
ncbi:rRNA-processing protein and EBNA1-binding protein ebp2 [Geranomyces variabilis]|uniref:rRNA-processing protein and EBNA1-binding protein ebp2 n=1 Tax=Geranomyces variabilis TaxID=109894 RepID=A0AAD5XNX8_9FUNG|nr:rRNA-processing protein and EBNA1-binding protein ebp2 [Geranomyces variabilis]